MVVAAERIAYTDTSFTVARRGSNPEQHADAQPNDILISAWAQLPTPDQIFYTDFWLAQQEPFDTVAKRLGNPNLATRITHASSHTIFDHREAFVASTTAEEKIREIEEHFVGVMVSAGVLQRPRTETERLYARGDINHMFDDMKRIVTSDIPNNTLTTQRLKREKFAAWLLTPPHELPSTPEQQ